MTSYSLKHIKIIFLITVLIIAGGIAAFLNLPRDEDPGFVIRTAVVTTAYPGADSEKVELLVTSKLEKIIQEMPEIDYIQSISKSGISIIYVNILDEYKNPRPIWDELRRKVEKSELYLPEGTQKSFVEDEFGDVFGTILSIIGDGFSYQEIKNIADYVKDELLLMPDVAKVELIGTQKEVVFLEYDIGRLAQFGLAPPQLKEILENTNILASGGNVKILDERLIIEPSGDFRSIEDIKKTAIKVQNRKEIIYLGDIVNVKRGYLDPPDTIVHSTGKRAIALAISMKEGADILNLGEKIKSKVLDMQTDLPLGIDFDTVSSQADYVKQVTNKFTFVLFQSAFIVTSVILIFLGLRIGSVVASLIPITLLLVFIEMFFFKINLDKLSIAALIVSLGIIIDNSIVVAESVLVKIAKCLPRNTAVLLSIKELYSPLMVATFTTSLAFIPAFFSQSIAGEYCSAMFKVIVMALFSSLILVLTIIPVLFNIFFPEQKSDALSCQIVDSEFYSEYKKYLLKLMDKPKEVFSYLLLSIGIIFIIFNFFIPKEFFPYSNRPAFQLEIESPQSTSIEKTEEITQQIEKFLSKELNKKNGIINWSAYIGSGLPRYTLSANPEPLNPAYASFLINLSSFAKVTELMDKTRNFCENNFLDANLSIKKIPTGPIFNAPVEIRVSGRDTDKIFDYVHQIKDELLTFDSISEISDDWGIKNRIITVKINPSKAYRAGISNKDIAISLQSAFSGFNLSDYREGDELIPIVYRTTEAYRDYLGKINTLNVYSENAKISVPLKQVADVSLKWSYPQIIHRNRIKTVTIKVQPQTGTTAYEINRKLIPFLKKASKNWDKGYFWEIGGSEEKFIKASNSIRRKIPIAFIGMFLLMMMYFNSFKKVFLIFAGSLLPLIGSVLGLFLTGTGFNFITFLGFLCLFGIVINHVILLVDRIETEVKINPENIQNQVIIASKARFRPVVLAIFTAIAGLFPLWWMNDSMFSSMAVAMIFGLLSAIFFTLFIIPVAYMFVYRNVK